MVDHSFRMNGTLDLTPGIGRGRKKEINFDVITQQFL